MSSAFQPAGIASFKDARHTVERHAAQVSPGGTESSDLLSAFGRVLGVPILADRDFPPFNRATRDGYAVRSEDITRAPIQLDVIGEIKAGDLPDQFTVSNGQAVSIMTGVGLPPGADAVVMVEYTEQTGTAVEIQRPIHAGENFVPRGSEARQGQLLLDRGTHLDHAAIAVAAAVGKEKIEVFRKPKVAVLSTGDEVVDIHTAPGPAQIRNSNSFSLAAQIRQAGGDPVVLPIAPDEPKRLRALIDEGLQADLLLLTGGVSMGKYDLVEQVLSELDAEFYFTGAQIQPGKPIVFGSCAARSSHRRDDQPDQAPQAGMRAPHRPMPDKKYFFGLPGNPVSTMVTFRLFVEPMIEALCGMKPHPLVFLKARLKSEIQTKVGLTRFLPGLLSCEFEKAEVEPVRWQGSGDIAALTVANCYVVIPPDREKIEAGEWVSLLTP